MGEDLRLLLDTHALLWFAVGDGRLPGRVRPLIEDAGNQVIVSAASAWEIAAKFRKGKLPQSEYLVVNWFEILAHLRMQELPISAAHALRSGLLALENADPFDRVIAAQALIEGLPVASIEATWDAIGVVRVWE